MFDSITLKLAVPQALLIAALIALALCFGYSQPVIIALAACSLSNLGFGIGLLWINRTGGIPK